MSSRLPIPAIGGAPMEMPVNLAFQTAHAVSQFAVEAIATDLLCKLQPLWRSVYTHFFRLQPWVAI